MLVHSSTFSGQPELACCWGMYLGVLLCVARAAASFGWKLATFCLLSYPHILDSTFKHLGKDSFGKSDASLDRVWEWRLQLCLPAQQLADH